MKPDKKLVVIVGVGSGLGLSIAKKFAKEKFTVALIARNQEQLNSLVNEIKKTGGHAAGFSADVTKTEELIAVFNQIVSQFGSPEVLIYNAASKFELKSISEISPADFIDNWKVSCLGGLVSAQQVLPNMIKQNHGTIIFTGATAALRGGVNTATFAMGKFSQRALAQSMAREFSLLGIHVVHAIIDGHIATPKVLAMFPNRSIDTFLDPNAIAETYWQLHIQPKTAWTHEIDLRPSVEKF